MSSPSPGSQENALFGADAHDFSRGIIKKGQTKLDKRSQIRGFRRFSPILQIFTFFRSYKFGRRRFSQKNHRRQQIFAENCRKPQNFAEARLSNLVCPF